MKEKKTSNTKKDIANENKTNQSKKMEYFVDTSILKGNLNEVKWKFKG